MMVTVPLKPGMEVRQVKFLTRNIFFVAFTSSNKRFQLAHASKVYCLCLYIDDMYIFLLHIFVYVSCFCFVMGGVEHLFLFYTLIFQFISRHFLEMFFIVVQMNVLINICISFIYAMHACTVCACVYVYICIHMYVTVLSINGIPVRIPFYYIPYTCVLWVCVYVHMY